MAHQKDSIDDNDWHEVYTINSYAIFMGYLLMGVKGLGFLVLTWTTVVLLGGFVSVLQKKDFWCLIVIMLVQTAGVFDFLLKEKASDVGDSLRGLLFAVVAAVVIPFKKNTNTSANSSKLIEDDEEPSLARWVVALVILVVQVLVLAILLCPLAVLYMLGLYLCTGIYLWRLIQHDYGDPDGGANLKPALNVLYLLAVAQGVVYSYSAIYDSAARTGLVKVVAKAYSLETELVSEYLNETVAGCMKDPSFARGRNLVTYAVDLLMESKSKYGYISGVLILGRVTLKRRWPRGQTGFVKQLLTGSASLSHVVQRLVETFGPRSPYNTEIRMRAASIVANVAGSICLDEQPVQGMVMIESISSLLDTFEQYSWQPESGERYKRDWGDLVHEYERDWLLDEEEQWYSYRVDKIPGATFAADSKTQESDSGNQLLQGYRGLVVQGLRILHNLAINGDNCKVLSNTQSLLSKTMVPLISEELHGDHHDVWSNIAVESLEFINRLMATLGGTEATKLRSQISSNSQATIFRTIECHNCDMSLKRQAAQVLLQLNPDTPPSIVPGGSRGNSIISAWIWLHIFLLPDDSMCGSTHLAKKSNEIARLAGKKMQAMTSSNTEASDTSMLPSVGGDIIGGLGRTVAGAENSTYRIHAATILNHLCRYYAKGKDNETFKELKKAIANVMPEVLKEIAQWLMTEDKQAVTEANNGGIVLLAEEGLDLEQGGVPHGNGQESSSTSHQPKGEQHQGIQLQKALLDLCWEIYLEWLLDNQDLIRQFDDITAKICSGQRMPHKTLTKLVREARDRRRRGLQDWKLYVYKLIPQVKHKTDRVRGLVDCDQKPETSNIRMHFAPSGFSV